FQADSALPQTADLTGIQVLVVDDEADARELLVMQLAQYGAEVKIVSSAVEAIESLQTIRPDVLVSDIGMPEVDGYALMRQVRALPPEAGGTLPAIALTAYAREEDLQQAIASGFQRHIAKPLEPLALAQAIAELVRR
ncbi:MAG: response regulator, partial [Leptolyngbya sp. SIO4C5]|nr:response regulator [Leptolyngbya sp. SIO4C5]